MLPLRAPLASIPLLSLSFWMAVGSTPSTSAPPASTPLVSLSFWMSVGVLPRRVLLYFPSVFGCPWGILPWGVLPLRVLPRRVLPPSEPLTFGRRSTPPTSAPSASCLGTYLVLRLASKDYKYRKIRKAYSPSEPSAFGYP